MITDLIVVAICSYRRPTQLRALLSALPLAVGRYRVEIVVVDNDVEQSARAVAEEFSNVRYSVEPVQGIATARNASVTMALLDAPWAIAFIDDDEIPEPGWLASLAQTLTRSGADVSTGGVIYDVGDAALEEISTFQYLTSRQHEDGSPVKYVATNNTLVLASWFLSNRFDRSFDLTGGSDLEFFIRLQSQGAQCVWSTGAKVRTLVTADRLTVAWNLKREMRNGQLMARLGLRFDGESRSSIAREGSRRILKGLFSFVPEAMGHPEQALRSRLWMADGTGWLRAAFGRHFEEYAIDKPPRRTRSPRTFADEARSL